MGPLSQDTLEKCGKCGEVVREHIIRALGRAFHPTCFTCVSCARCIGDENFALDSQNEVYCLDDFYRKFAPVCSICENPIIPRDGKDAFKIECMGRNFHENCYRCEDTLEKCGKCGEVVREHIIRALGRAFHPTCFTCVSCARCIGDENFALDSQNEVYCLDDFYRKFAPVCSICENPIIPRDGKDAFKIECMGRNFHENCYRCEDCRVLLSVEPTDQGCYPLNDRLFCKPCHVKRSAAGCC
ncbi:Filamin-binding LIM protein 1 [Myotis brandtii]|uniref:Filamin-binding LIM protein 1 n=1 Tax=Myotis brandtii TaxID=109478 RepID=S7QFW1_MYOBR|nr:Filamin-binding LIM protein 1 [Myotis brandtii]